MTSAKPIVGAGVGDIAGLIPDWARSLRAENRSPRTVEVYITSTEQLVAFLTERGMPTAVDAIRREHVEAFVEHVLERWRPAPASVRYRALPRFCLWAGDEGEIAETPRARMRPPAVPETPVPVLGADELKRLLATGTRACSRCSPVPPEVRRSPSAAYFPP